MIAGNVAVALVLFELDARTAWLVVVTAGPALYLAHRAHQAALPTGVPDDRDSWIAQVCHDLRTPLTPIKGFLHTLQRRDEQFTSQDRQRLYEVMIREEQRLEDILSSLQPAADHRGEAPEGTLDGSD
ncbi:MAG: histidine kinase dimerization/phospho-acceptor domain-containing protein [Actinomycetota bacterium]